MQREKREEAENEVAVLRRHITDQHALLVAQQRALREEHEIRRQTNERIEGVKAEVRALQDELQRAEAEGLLQRRHAALLERTLAALCGTAPSPAPFSPATADADASGPAARRDAEARTRAERDMAHEERVACLDGVERNKPEASPRTEVKVRVSDKLKVSPSAEDWVSLIASYDAPHI